MNSTLIQVYVPEELGFALQLKGGALGDEMLPLAVIKLYELGRLSSGKAANMLGVSRIKFLEICGSYQVSIVGNLTAEEINEDLYSAGRIEDASSDTGNL
jgi:hypothetical protein